LQHPNVVQFIGYAAKESQHMIVSELLGKDLRSYLDETVHEGRTRPALSLLLAVDIMLQIAEPMKYLHEKGMMHRDLKANNILINVVESEELCISPSVQVKLTDFGFSKLNHINSRFTSPETGSTLWRAPELFVYKHNTAKYRKAADVYSYAMVFYEVLTGKMPWCDAQGNPTVRMSDLLARILRGERPALPWDCPAHLSAFISKCWATRAEDRPQFPEICKFLWQYKGQILTTGNSEILFEGHGTMANIRATTFNYEPRIIEYDDVCRGKECLGIGGYAPVFKSQYHGEMVPAKMFRISKDEVKLVENEASLQAGLQQPNVVDL
jgi:serine/threonine protein kinase